MKNHLSEEAFLSFTKTKETGKKSKLQQEFNEKQKNTPPKKTSQFNIQDFILSQQPQNSSIEHLEKERKYLKNIRNSVIPTEYFKIENTLKFFQQHTLYFVKHPLEFQRLVAQLHTNERQIFLHSIYTYYYPDVLLAMKQIKPEVSISLKDFTDDTKAIDSIHLDYIRDDPETGNVKFDTQKVCAIHRCIRENLTELQNEQTNSFYNLLLNLNSQEIYMLEELLLQKPTL